MSHTPREIGTLIIVIDKANHLPNKRHIGKQDPYCSVEFEGKKGRTKTIKRGGQHPEWDEELRFPVYEDVEDELARTAGEERAPSPPPKDDTSSKPSSLRQKSRSKKAFKLAVFADDAREPELIGETMVDLATVLTKGEQDEWHTLMHKDKFAGKVYVELTFYSNEEPPKPTKAKALQAEYSGPGDFTAAEPVKPRTVSTSHNGLREPRTALRNPSGVELYNPPYDRSSSVAAVTNDFGQLAMTHSVRRESFPPVSGHDGDYRPRHSMSLPMDRAQGYESDTESAYSTMPPVQPYQHYPAPYEPSPVSYGKSTIRGPRYSVPVGSGFRPLNQSRVLPSHPSEPSTFAPPLSHSSVPSLYGGSTPAPYNASHFSTYAPMPSQTPLPHPVASIMSYPPPPQPYGYPQYPPPAPGAPVQQYPQAQTPPQQSYSPYPDGSPSPPNEPMPASASLSSSHGPGGSRPLPQPQQAPGVQYPPPIPAHTAYEYANGNSIMFPSVNGYPVPPPPPPPLNGSPPRSPHQQYLEPQHQYPEQYHDGSYAHSQPPVSQYEPRQPQSRPSLPQPPQQRGALPIPPPAPPGAEFQPGYTPSSHLGIPQPYIPGPPPRPPQLDAAGHWVPPPPPQAGWA